MELLPRKSRLKFCRTAAASASTGTPRQAAPARRAWRPPRPARCACPGAARAPGTARRSRPAAGRRARTGDVAQRAGLGKRQDARERDVEPQVERAGRFVGRAAEAVHHAADLAPPGLGEDAKRVLGRLARVNHDREAALESEFHLGGKHLALDVARREVVVVVEPDLADRHRLAGLGGLARGLARPPPRDRRRHPTGAGACRREAQLGPRRRDLPRALDFLGSSAERMQSAASTPAAFARAMTSSRSGANASSARWQCESMSI